VRRALPCGDYGLAFGGRLVASVGRKSLADLISSLTSGRFRYALAKLAALPRAAVVVEDRYSAIFRLDRLRPSMVADNLAEVEVRWPNVPIVFCETRPLAEEWTYRFLAAARAWAETEAAVSGRMQMEGERGAAPVASAQPGPSSAEVRAWAALEGLAVPARGRLGREVWDAWHAARPDPSPEAAV
jgi:ERCC4 domain/Lsr2